MFWLRPTRGGFWFFKVSGLNSRAEILSAATVFDNVKKLGAPTTFGILRLIDSHKARDALPAPKKA